VWVGDSRQLVEGVTHDKFLLNQWKEDDEQFFKTAPFYPWK
jgi:hypothetical protein